MTHAEPAHHGFDAARLGRIATWMQAHVDERRYPGCSVLILRGAEEVFFHATGQRSIEAGLPFARDTLVRLYSMTKPVTTVAAMMLVERGLFHLDAPLSDFIPAFTNCHALVPGAKRIDQTEPCATPTLHQIMTHTGGLSYPFNPGPLPQAMEAEEILFKPDQGRLAAMVDRVARLPLAFAPGTRWEYSVGIDILGRVIEVVTGRTLEAVLADEVLAPLGMTETGFSVPEGAGTRFASLYTPSEGAARALNPARAGCGALRLVDEAGSSPFEATTLFSGGGGLVGTIDDYMRFAEMLRRGGEAAGGRILGPGTVDFMLRNHLPGDIASMGPQSFAEQPMEGVGFGLGGAVVLDPARMRIPGSVGDFSWGGMASTFFWIDRRHELSVVFFTQLAPSSAYPSRAQLKALVHGAMAE